MIRRLALICTLLGSLLGGTAVAAAPPSGPAVDAVLAYVRALGSGDYPRAYALLSTQDQKYYGSVDNYASVWKADRFTVSKASAIALRTLQNTPVVVIRGDGSFFDHGRQAVRATTFTLPYAYVKEGGRIRVRDADHPYRAVLPAADVDGNGVRLTVRKLSFYLRRIEAVVTYVNHGDGFVTFLSYRRTVLKDDQQIYPIYETRNWLLTDQQLFLGLRLADGARYTASLNFEANGRLDDRARTFSLSVAPALRDGEDQPFGLEFPPIAVPAQ